MLTHAFAQPACSQLDEKFGDLFHRILGVHVADGLLAAACILCTTDARCTETLRADLEGALLCDLKNRVLEHAPALAAAAASAAELDCLVALARGARQLNLHRPHLTRDNVLRIKNGAARLRLKHTQIDLNAYTLFPYSWQAATCCTSRRSRYLCPTTQTLARPRGA
jgi:hypothetical protein